MASQTKSLAELASDVETCSIAFENAQTQANHARREETIALNRLNEAQRALDAKMTDLRKTAPNGTGWKTPAGVVGQSV